MLKMNFFQYFFRRLHLKMTYLHTQHYGA